jgi:hypothetical protein
VPHAATRSTQRTRSPSVVGAVTLAATALARATSPEPWSAAPKPATAPPSSSAMPRSRSPRAKSGKTAAESDRYPGSRQPKKSNVVGAIKTSAMYRTTCGDQPSTAATNSADRKNQAVPRRVSARIARSGAAASGSRWYISSRNTCDRCFSKRTRPL